MTKWKLEDAMENGITRWKLERMEMEQRDGKQWIGYERLVKAQGLKRNAGNGTETEIELPGNASLISMVLYGYEHRILIKG